MPGLDHRRQHLLCGVEGARAVGPEAIVELLGREVQYSAHLEGARVVDEDLRVSELFAYPSEGGYHRVGVCSVGRDGYRLASDLLLHPRNVLLSACHEGNGEAFGGEAPGDSRAEPRTYPEYRRHSVAHALFSSPDACSSSLRPRTSRSLSMPSSSATLGKWAHS